MISDHILRIHNLIDPDEKIKSSIEAANYLCAMLGGSKVCRTGSDAIQALKMFLQRLLNARDYLNAARLCWGEGKLFDPRPQSVSQIWHELETQDKLLIMGAGSLGKTYTVMAHDLLDWSSDPWNTTVKLISTTAGHARNNCFATMVRLHNESRVPLPGYIQQGFIGMDKDERRASIAELAIPPGEDGKARLQGFHPLPRVKAHPIYGLLTRVIADIDEAEAVAAGLWQGSDNLLLNRDIEQHVKIRGMTNPIRRDSTFAYKAEPRTGWSRVSLDHDKQWVSREGWKVLRLDGADCENVRAKKVIFPGLLTYEGYMELVNRGEDTAAYYTFARGMYPTETASYNVIAPYFLDNARGTYLWGQHPTPLATFDSAFEEGGDRAIFTGAKYGLAIAFQPEGGELIRYDIPRWVIQVEQQFEIEKKNGIVMGAEIIELCRLLRVSPEWFGMDKTGNATVLYHWLLLNFGTCLGINWGEGATEQTILEEDTDKACDLYDDVVTEMMFATARWIEFGYMAFSPSMDTFKVFNQLSNRRYKPIGKVKVKLEKKKEFKKRYNDESPDNGDSLIMTTHVVRMRVASRQAPAMQPTEKEPDEDYMEKGAGEISFVDSDGVVDKQRFIHAK